MIAFVVINDVTDLSKVHRYLEHCYQPTAAYVALVTYWIDDDANSLVYIAASWHTIRQQILEVMTFTQLPIVLSISYAWPEDIQYLESK